MCIIVYKSAEAKMPDFKKLKVCCENNSDGAGYMFADNGKVHIRKGFMKYSSFEKAFKNTIAEFGEDRAYVIHFRISTQAGIRKDCTHPFPLSKNMNKLRNLNQSCEIGIAHNGIIPLTSDLRKNLDYSDTMEFITEYLSLIIQNKNYYKNPDTLKLIEKLSDSKLAILDNEGHCEIIGSNWVVDDDILYSNETFEPYIYSGVYGNYGFHGGYQYASYEDDILECYDEETDAYYFEQGCCPGMLYEDYRFCKDCINFSECG